MVEKQTLMKSLASVDDLHEIYEHIEYKGIKQKDQIRDLKHSYNWNKNPKTEELIRFPHMDELWKNRKKIPKNRTIMGSTG